MTRIRDLSKNLAIYGLGDVAIQVLNFGAEGNIQRSDQIGLLRTGST